MSKLILILASIYSSHAFAASVSATGFVCDYIYYTVPFTKVEVSFNSAGELEPRAKITSFGKSHTETVTLETPASGEMHRFTLSKESAENWITMIIYPDLSSKLVNPHVSVGNEMAGTCVR